MRAKKPIIKSNETPLFAPCSPYYKATPRYHLFSFGPMRDPGKQRAASGSGKPRYPRSKLRGCGEDSHGDADVMPRGAGQRQRLAGEYTGMQLMRISMNLLN